MIVRDLAAEMEPEAGPLADFTGGEEGIEDALRQIGRNSRAAVGHDDLHPLPVGARGDADPPPFARSRKDVPAALRGRLPADSA